MKTLRIGFGICKRMNYMLVPLKNVNCIEVAENDEPETHKIHLDTTEGIVFLDAKKFIVNGKSLDELIKEQETKQ